MSERLARELHHLVEGLRQCASRENEVEDALRGLQEATLAFDRAWSGSSLGYHTRVYHRDVTAPPTGSHFSPEWGFHSQIQGTTGDWVEYEHEYVVSQVEELAGNPNLSEARGLAEGALKELLDARPEVVSILSAFLTERSDDLVVQLRTEARQCTSLDMREAIQAQLPSGGQTMTRDSLAATQGVTIAPHREVRAQVLSIRSTFRACATLAGVTERARRHIERLEGSRQHASEAVTGQDIFIGHGRSPQWRELKDFVRDRLHLPWEEFDRVSVAGTTTVARLSEMLDNAGMAFIILTAEDETTEGLARARQNVVHEAGLFQGRLGFQRAIVLLEEGCEEFSNIHGLGQIRFPPGNLRACFDDVRRVLEREGFIDT